MQFLSPRQETRLLRNVREEAPAACWEWRGNTWSSGYGRFFLNGRYHPAHRVMYETYVGPVPPELDIDHLCRNRLCVNPAHLEPVTRRVNVLRGVGMGARYALRDTCQRGHPLSGDNVSLYQHARRCRACRRERYVKHAREVPSACPKGHPYPESWYVGPDGRRYCRPCRTERHRRWVAAQKSFSRG